MANRDIEAAAGAEIPALQAQQNAYLHESRSIEQGPSIVPAELPQMESGLRNRNPTAPPSTLVGGDGAPESEGAAPDLSSDGGPSPDAPRLASLVRTGSKGLQALITTGSWSAPDPDELKRHNESRGYDNLKYDRVEDFEEGYPQLAAFIDSNDTFANYRRFGRLSTRILLHMQNGLNGLEKMLDDLDKQDAQDDTMKYRLRGFKISGGRDDKYQKLCADIHKKYVEYADVLLKDASIRVWSFLKTAEERRKTNNEAVDHYSKHRLALLAIILQVVVAAVLFLVPVFILFLVPTNRAVMAVTASVFVLVFTAAVSFMTGAKIQEVFLEPLRMLR